MSVEVVCLTAVVLHVPDANPRHLLEPIVLVCSPESDPTPSIGPAACLLESSTMASRFVSVGVRHASRRLTERPSQLPFLARWFAAYPPHEVVGMPSLSPVSVLPGGLDGGRSGIVGIKRPKTAGVGGALAVSLTVPRSDHGIGDHRELESH